MNYWYFLIPVTFLLLIVLFLITLHFKRQKNIQKILALSTLEKTEFLNHLAAPLGYLYDPIQDIFATRLDAPQKLFGYHTFYDLAASYFNMIFDYETIYFDYNGRTWLLEIWKGQYGINIGCELGLYYADSILSPHDYDNTHFEAVAPKDMLDISVKLNRHCSKGTQPCNKIAYRRHRHWWLTIFKLGSFAKPEELFVNTSIRFKDYTMLKRFLDSFEETLPDTMYKINGLTVYFTFCKSKRTYPLFKRLVRHIALFSCHLYCNWFQFITRSFTSSGDKLLYLYYYLPFVVRHMLKPKKAKK